jgi:hypothetical protein
VELDVDASTMEGTDQWWLSFEEEGGVKPVSKE